METRVGLRALGLALMLTGCFATAPSSGGLSSGQTETNAVEVAMRNPGNVEMDEALRIAWAHAAPILKDQRKYRAAIHRDAESWVVEFEIASARTRGGGAKVVIDASKGTVLDSEFGQ